MAVTTTALDAAQIQSVHHLWDEYWKSALLENPVSLLTTIDTTKPTKSNEYIAFREIPVPVPTSWDGKATISNIDVPGITHRDTYTISRVAAGRKLRLTDVQEGGKRVEDAAMQLAQAIEVAVLRQVELAFPAWLTQTQDDGAGGTTAVFSAGHAYGTTGTSTQSNLLTTALSASALANARKILRAWRDATGRNAGFGRGPFVLLVPPDLEDTARQVLGTPFSNNVQTFTNATENIAAAATGPGDLNVRRQEVWRVHVLTEAADPNDWGVVDLTNGPTIRLWMPWAPQIVVPQFPDPGTQSWTITASVAFRVIPPPGGDGIVWSQVA